MSEPRVRAALVVVGKPPATDRVCAALEPMGRSIATAHDAECAMPLLHPRMVAIVVAGFGVSKSLKDTTLRLATYGRDHRVPVVVLVGDGYAPHCARELYAAGACAVFAWPTEGPLIAPTVETLANVMRRAGYPTAADTALARSVEARLDAVVEDLTPHVSADGPRVVLAGVLTSLVEKREVERHLSLVPGIEAWDLSGVILDVDVTSDLALARRARARLSNTPGVPHDTLGVTAHDGRLVLAGTVKDDVQLERVLEAIVDVRGVRDIENLVTVCREQTDEDRGRAARAKVIVDALLADHEGVQVSVFGPVAVLTGRTADPVPVQGLQARLSPLGLDRVIDSIDVRA